MSTNAKEVAKGVPNARAVAVEALIRIEDGAFAHILLPELLRQHAFEPRDRAFVTELVYGTVRMQRALDFLLARVSSRPIARLDPDVRAALRLGAFQLFTGVSPPPAAGGGARGGAGGARGLTQ